MKTAIHLAIEEIEKNISDAIIHYIQIYLATVRLHIDGKIKAWEDTLKNLKSLIPKEKENLELFYKSGINSCFILEKTITFEEYYTETFKTDK